ncbi:MAG: hypothetical protein GY716_25730 [bacterium]|nr:hypothetical protein [bacterium]
MTHRWQGFVGLMALLVLLVAGTTMAGTGGPANECDEPGEEPDIIVGSISDANSYGSVGDIAGFSIGTVSCNIGTCWAEWLSGTPYHPVIGQNMFRLKDGRFEQIGQSWLKHGFATLNGGLCGSCVASDGQHLGVNCSDPYGAGLNGSQSSLGPRFEVNPSDGSHAHPYTFQGQTGDSIYKRLQVHHDDLDPTMNAGAQYYVEAQYVTEDDAAAGNNHNNSGFRSATVFPSGGSYNLTLFGTTSQQTAAVQGWDAIDNDVYLSEIVLTNDGQIWVASRAYDLGGGQWHYEYAVQNVTSDRAVGSFSVPLPAGTIVSNVGFHDVDYHSGEPYDGTDWDMDYSGTSITWSTEDHADNADANAIRWGTMYNFRFQADIGPSVNRATLGMFKPGFPNTTDARAMTPNPAGSGSGGAGEVPDGTGFDPAQLTVNLSGGGQIELSWGSSCVLNDDDYAVYEGTLGDYTSHIPATCTTAGAQSHTMTPAAASSYYLIVPHNGSDEGSYGKDGDGTPRTQNGGACYVQDTIDCL